MRIKQLHTSFIDLYFKHAHLYNFLTQTEFVSIPLSTLGYLNIFVRYQGCRETECRLYHLKTRLYITIYCKEVSIPTFNNFAYFPSFFVFQTYIVIILKHVKLYTGE